MRLFISSLVLLLRVVQCDDIAVLGETATTTSMFLPMVNNLAEITLLGSTSGKLWQTTWAAPIAAPTDGEEPYDGWDVMTITDNGIVMSYEFTRTSAPFAVSIGGSTATLTGDIATTSQCEYSHNFLDPEQADRFESIAAASTITIDDYVSTVVGPRSVAICKADIAWSASGFSSSTTTGATYFGDAGFSNVTITPGSVTNSIESWWVTATTTGEPRTPETGSSATTTAAEKSSSSNASASEEPANAALRTATVETAKTQSTSTQAAAAAEVTVWKEVVIVVAMIAALAI